MSKKYLPAILILLTAGVVLAAVLLLQGHTIAILQPKGQIAQHQFDLMVITALLSLIVVVPVFAMTAYIAWNYREGNTKAKYQPNWDHSQLAESIWWFIPLALISILAAITWVSSHRLDPYKPLASTNNPLTIQVVALQWKWLFIYPQQDIASVNYVQLPVDTPVTFEITADAPMNSFWIPQLGGQVYAMAGMQTKLHLMASEAGNYRGSSANISGEGFAGMKFTAHASSQEDFDQWVQTAKQSPKQLGKGEYTALAKPSKDNKVATYAAADENLYHTIMMKYMAPNYGASAETNLQNAQGTQHVHSH